ncbi:MAG: hypothetical protein A3H98_12970 [Bacteroidetes bacterium RIFCSPLOWO2_02_FULL_36_8]|nr:MAG: hypothetical protein A3H98_12970 [Bacteroidetes bacterium RIFCSPLOWO2_02_FULL_36_8]OFY69626.1 MAG: hypothetical protein A3G23_13920 [Bacteroidetes bacterium RIFCSPLOWO2_12_FULL_37_12]
MDSPIKILLVDDDVEDHIITRTTLKKIPYQKYLLECVSDFEEGVTKLKSVDFDVCLVDYQLGKQTGLEFIERIKKIKPWITCILLTGQGFREIDEMAMKAGASDYLIKGNVTPDQLERSIRYSLRQSGNLKEISTLNQELEARVNKRTEELDLAIKELEKAKDEISHALEKEKELNELKSRFVTMASHEFRTPLSTILSSAQLIDRYNQDNDKEKVIRHTQRIRSSVQNMTDILNDFLSLSKMEEGAILLSPRQIEFRIFVEKILEEVRVLVKEGQKIVHLHSGSTEQVLLDPQFLKNIIINLLSNAIKYSYPLTQIKFSTHLTEKELQIKVEDRGIGIPIEDLPHLFTRFFRAKNVINIQGTGLGLNIVKKHIDLMGGTIDFKSELNKGSVFSVKIPLATENL